MRRMMINVVVAVVLVGACVWPGEAVRAQELRVSSSRTYVMSYEVQGGIAVPVMGVLTNSITFGVRASAERPRPPLRARYDERKALDKFFAETLPPRRLETREP